MSLHSRQSSARNHTVIANRHGFRVVSGSSFKSYHVHIGYEDGKIGSSCSCDWCRYGGECCSHIMAVLMHLASKQNRSIRFWTSLDEAQRQHRRLLSVGSDIYITTRKKVG